LPDSESPNSSEPDVGALVLADDTEEVVSSETGRSEEGGVSEVIKGELSPTSEEIHQPPMSPPPGRVSLTSVEKNYIC
jgi:hypothetical protein